MPGLTGRDKRPDGSILACLLLQCVSDEFGAVIHPDHPGRFTVLEAGKVEQFDYRSGIKLPINCESDVFAGVFIDNVADLDRLTVPG